MSLLARLVNIFRREQLEREIDRELAFHVSERVDELVEAGEGVRFDANKGTPMKEWFVLHPGSPMSWSELTGEALAYARR